MPYGPSIQDDVRRAREIIKDGVVGKDLYAVIQLLTSLADEVERLRGPHPQMFECGCRTQGCGHLASLHVPECVICQKECWS